MSLGPQLRRWSSAALAFFYPEVCQICQEKRAGPQESFVCGSCRRNVRFIERPFCERCGVPFAGDITVEFECTNCGDRRLYFTWARSAVAAKGTVLTAIHHYKYHKALWIEPWLAGLLVERAAPDLSNGTWDWLVPVPLHPVRQREREYNQAERLAKHLGQAAEVQLNTRVLRRVTPTPSQTRFSREQREENVKGAFALQEGADARGKRVVLIDDVFTTGATTNECARVLCRAGAAQVCVWTLARGI